MPVANQRFDNGNALEHTLLLDQDTRLQQDSLRPAGAQCAGLLRGCPGQTPAFDIHGNQPQRVMRFGRVGMRLDQRLHDGHGGFSGHVVAHQRARDDPQGLANIRCRLRGHETAGHLQSRRIGPCPNRHTKRRFLRLHVVRIGLPPKLRGRDRQRLVITGKRVACRLARNARLSGQLGCSQILRCGLRHITAFSGDLSDQHVVHRLRSIRQRLTGLNAGPAGRLKQRVQAFARLRRRGTTGHQDRGDESGEHSLDQVLLLCALGRVTNDHQAARPAAQSRSSRRPGEWHQALGSYPKAAPNPPPEAGMTKPVAANPRLY